MLRLFILGAVLCGGLMADTGFDHAQADRFARLALDCVHKQYPNKIAHSLNSDADVKAPRELTPAFYGCYDWHSSVHGHWLLGRPVVDKTGLTGLYDYKLEWTPDQVQLASDETSGRPADENVPSLTSALQEQMGLRLQSQKGPVEIIVVDRAEKATAN